MNTNKKTKNIKTNKNIDFIEMTNRSDTSKALDNKENINSAKKENNSFS